jgi:DNA-binding CsgD family transcriptional regulator
MLTQEQSLRRVRDVIDAGMNAPAVPGRLASPVLTALAALVPGDGVSFVDFDAAATTHYAEDEVADGEVSFLEAPLVEPEHPFWRAYEQSLFCSYPARSGDDRSVTMRSDFYGTQQWKQTAMYSGDRIDFELMCPMPNLGRRTRRVLFYRSGSVDFTEHDRFVLALLRPHLMEMLRPRRAEAHAPELTDRQQELMQLVADGRTNAEIAATLHLSPHTVRTHLMNIFERLGVTTRAAAVARVFAP